MSIVVEPATVATAVEVVDKEEEMKGMSVGVVKKEAVVYLDEADAAEKRMFIQNVLAVEVPLMMMLCGLAAGVYSMRESYAPYVDKDAMCMTMEVVFIGLCVLQSNIGKAKTYPNNLIFFGLGTMAAMIFITAYFAYVDAWKFLITCALVALFNCCTYAFIRFTSYSHGTLSTLSTLLLVLVVAGTYFSIEPLLYGSFFAWGMLGDLIRMIEGKNPRYRFKVDEWAFASLCFYLNLISISFPPYPGSESKIDEEVSTEVKEKPVAPEMLDATANSVASVVMLPHGNIEQMSSGGDYNYALDEMDISVRHGFVIKVLSALALQRFLVVLGVIAISNVIESLDSILWPLLILLILMMNIRKCCVPCVRVHPKNIIMFSVATLVEVTTLGLLCVRPEDRALLIVEPALMFVVISFLLFVAQSKSDFTQSFPYTFILLLALTIHGLVCIYLPFKLVDVIYSAIIVLPLSACLVKAVMRIFRGKDPQFRFGVHEWLFACFNLYMNLANAIIQRDV